jgi:NADH-quinone oxidoreductase subunit C
MERKPAPPGITPLELERNKLLAQRIKSKFGNNILELYLDLGDVVAVVAREHLLDFAKILKLDSELRFDLLLNVTAVDWLDSRDARFEVVYHFLSIANSVRLRVKVPLLESDAAVESLVPLFAAANFMEREAWDMLGISFRNHPDLRRILMYDEFVGYPLRKDYPVQGKQPRIPLRSPEVQNTARDMIRPPLYAINSRKAEAQSIPASGAPGTIVSGKGDAAHG